MIDENPSLHARENIMTNNVSVSLQAHVATVVFDRPPQNFFDNALINAIADAFEELDENSACRALVLASE
jgi:enoyl-CoA hydratase/carnithine racemase